MPRERDVTMGKISPQESYEAGLKKCVKLYSPFAIVDGELVNEKARYAVIYTAPRGSDREVVMTTNRRERARRLRDRLSRAWAQGFSASGKV